MSSFPFLLHCTSFWIHFIIEDDELSVYDWRPGSLESKAISEYDGRQIWRICVVCLCAYVCMCLCVPICVTLCLCVCLNRSWCQRYNYGVTEWNKRISEVSQREQHIVNTFCLDYAASFLSIATGISDLVGSMSTTLE